MPYKDGSGAEIFGPGENLPSEHHHGPVDRPAQGADFHWLASRTGPISRWRDRRVAKTIAEHTAGLQLAERYQRQAIDYEKARQELALTHQQAALIPLKMEVQHQEIQAQLLRGQLAVDAMLQDRDQAAKRSAAEHQIAMLHHKADKLEAQARVKAAKRVRKNAGKKKRPDAAPPGETPEPFRRYRATEAEVQRNRSAADTEIEGIFARVQAEGRTALSPDEVEVVDALRSAAGAAESEVRRRAAADF